MVTSGIEPDGRVELPTLRYHYVSISWLGVSLCFTILVVRDTYSLTL